MKQHTLSAALDALKMIESEFDRYISSCLFSSVWDSIEVRRRIEIAKGLILAAAYSNACTHLGYCSDMLGRQTATLNRATH